MVGVRPRCPGEVTCSAAGNVERLEHLHPVPSGDQAARGEQPRVTCSDDDHISLFDCARERQEERKHRFNRAIGLRCGVVAFRCWIGCDQALAEVSGKVLLMLLLLSAALLHSVSARLTTIDNTRPRRTNDGLLMDAHDGNIVQWHAGGRYYYYSMGYQNCTDPAGIFSHAVSQYGCPGVLKPIGACGFRTDHALNVYSSPDLTNWTFEGDALPIEARPRGVYFRPKVVFNRATSEYVLWINFLYEKSSHQTPLGAYPNATYLIGASKSPVGPFGIVTPSAHLQAKGAGDLAILVDDVTAYVVYDAWSNGHTFQLEQLDAQFYDVVRPAVTPAMLRASGEAPMIFKRRGWYYLIVGSGCEQPTDSSAPTCRLDALSVLACPSWQAASAQWAAPLVCSSRATRWPRGRTRKLISTRREGGASPSTSSRRRITTCSKRTCGEEVTKARSSIFSRPTCGTLPRMV